VPLGPAPDSQEPPSVDPHQPAFVQLSGVALNCDSAMGKFTLDVEVWHSATRSKVVTSFLCIIPDSPKYKSSGKPVPYNNRYISLSGYLTGVTSKVDDMDIIERFTVTVEDIVFMGSAAAEPSAGTIVPNSLDG
jgi:hypothetical protein